jgi:hypothetical protein
MRRPLYILDHGLDTGQSLVLSRDDPGHYMNPTNAKFDGIMQRCFKVSFKFRLSAWKTASTAFSGGYVPHGGVDQDKLQAVVLKARCKIPKARLVRI